MAQALAYIGDMKNELETLGNVIGGAAYLGQCPVCNAQHMSTHDRVQRRGHQNVCEKCAYETAKSPREASDLAIMAMFRAKH